MKTWFASQNGILVITFLIVAGSGLALANALATQGFTTRTIAASLLVLSFIVFLVGGVLFTGRAFLKWQMSEKASYLVWERAFVIAAVVMMVVGLALLEDLLRAAGESVLSRIGFVLFLFGAIVVVTAETAYLGKRDWNYPQIVFYVMLAFLAQAAFGASLLQTDIVASWAGWAAIIWNLGCFIVMLILRPREVYYPVLHHIAPLIIGIALLVG